MSCSAIWKFPRLSGSAVLEVSGHIPICLLVLDCNCCHGWIHSAVQHSLHSFHLVFGRSVPSFFSLYLLSLILLQTCGVPIYLWSKQLRIEILWILMVESFCVPNIISNCWSQVVHITRTQPWVWGSWLHISIYLHTGRALHLIVWCIVMCASVLNQF